MHHVAHLVCQFLAFCLITAVFVSPVKRSKICNMTFWNISNVSLILLTSFSFTGSTLLTLRRHVRECAALAPGNNILETQSSRAACEIWVHLVRVPLGARSSNRNLVHLSKYSLILCLNIAFWKMNPLCQTPSSNSHQVPRSDFYQLFFETLSSCALCMWNLNSFYPKPSFLRPQTMIVLSFDKGRNVMLKKWFMIDK